MIKYSKRQKIKMGNLLCHTVTQGVFHQIILKTFFILLKILLQVPIIPSYFYKHSDVAYQEKNTLGNLKNLFMSHVWHAQNLKKNSFRLSIYVIACPVGFLSLGNGMQKGCKKDFDKNQYTKKFVFQCHTVTHGIDFRKSPQQQNRSIAQVLWKEREID